MKKKKLLLIICIIVIAAMAFTGCRPARRPMPEEQTTPQEGVPGPGTGTPGAPAVPGEEGIAPTPGGGVPGPGQRVPGEQADDGTVRDARTPEDARTAPRNMQPAEMEQDLMTRADRIVNEVARMEEVRSATVVIFENTALVGVTLTEDTDGEINRGIERRIEETAREADRSVERVAVTADPNMFRRIQEISREAGEGRPLSGFGREIEEMFRRIVPGA
ncbi:sporulation lipoprotein YhcN/YlaJ [Clostridium aceticum]|uniref:Sporulation lipoprotein YhcN/YlaJ n=1 Tax=Clostridium aceticum TaxID=84022 RepID=A0A0G3WBB8_9CLOT|nr:YhcN/YlaJ family sporulation lipoprotein [Clostridium aceticum]AKL95638.1 sporulation lipoprotein YhcN/YlaJ [Clostridium aceticum]